MSSYGDIIQQGRKEEKQQKSQLVVNTANGKTRDEESVNITIKVPRKSRQFWTSKAKLEGLTMTEVLVEALTERFGGSRIIFFFKEEQARLGTLDESR